MRIAFDLDGTLIPECYDFPTHPTPRGFLSWMVTHEPLRLGTAELLPTLTRAGHELWIYTTSFRKPVETKLMFWLHGIRIKRVINTDIHQRRISGLGEAYKMCTKYPPAFGIDLLFDNSEAVLEESRRYGFRMVLLRPEDHDWVTTVQKALRLPS